MPSQLPHQNQSQTPAAPDEPSSGDQQATRENEALSRRHGPLQPGPKAHPEGVGDQQVRNDELSRVKRDEHVHANPEARENQRKLQAEHDAELLKDKAQRDAQSKQYDPNIAKQGQVRDRDRHEQAREQEGTPLDTAAKAQRDQQKSRQGVPGGLQDHPTSKQWPEGVSPNPELGPVPLQQDRNMGDPHPLAPALYDPIPPPGSPLAELQDHNAKNPTRTAEEVMNQRRAERAQQEQVQRDEQRGQVKQAKPGDEQQGSGQNLSKEDVEYKAQHVDPEKEAARQKEIQSKQESA